MTAHTLTTAKRCRGPRDKMDLPPLRVEKGACSGMCIRSRPFPRHVESLVLHPVLTVRAERAGFRCIFHSFKSCVRWFSHLYYLLTCCPKSTHVPWRPFRSFLLLIPSSLAMHGSTMSYTQGSVPRNLLEELQLGKKVRLKSVLFLSL